MFLKSTYKNKLESKCILLYVSNNQSTRIVYINYKITLKRLFYICDHLKKIHCKISVLTFIYFLCGSYLGSDITDCPLISCNQTCKNGLFQTKDGCQLCKCRGKYQDPAKK